MQIRDGSDETQAEPMTFAGPAAVEAIEATQHVAPHLKRNARSFVGDSDRRRLVVRGDADADAGSGWGVLKRILQKIDQQLHEEFAIALDRDAQSERSRQEQMARVAGKAR